MTPLQILKQFFGYDDFRPGQLDIINSIIDGKNILAILPTGGGKSICYQIPAILAPSFSIVISPLIALMKDQVDSLNKKENIAAYINSSLDFRDAEKVFQNISSGQIKLLYLSPEKIDNAQFASRIKLLNPAYIFIDEAHCISEWGHNFRPSYRKIKQFTEFLGLEKISAFTATATQDVRKDIIEQLGMKNSKIFVKGFERENLHLNVVAAKNKKEIIAKLLTNDSLPAIIYTATRKLTEELAEFLRTNGIEAAYYHAGMSSDIRKIVQDDFLSGRIKIVIATNAFGMGIDKSDIRTVIHHSIPGNLENYYQEIGRAGRDGKDSNIYLLFEDKDRLLQEFFIKNSNPSKEQIGFTYDAICDYGQVPLGHTRTNIPLDNDLLAFLATKDVNKSIAESSIRILSESGYIETESEFNKKHITRFLIDAGKLNTVVKNFSDNELKDLVLVLARDYGRSIFRARTLINIQRLCDSLNADHNEVLQGLETLAQSGLIEYEAPSKFPTINILKPRVRSIQLVLNYKKINDLYKHNIDKLEQMVEYVKDERCRFRFILNYFGEEVNNYKCGNCDNCRGVKPKFVNSLFIEEHILKTLAESESGIPQKQLEDILLGRSENSPGFLYSTFGSCSLFSKPDIESSINFLITSRKIFSLKGILKLSNHPADESIPDEIVRTTSDYEAGLELFNSLRQIRKEAAAKFNQSPNMICPDNTLREIAALRPKSFSELLEIKGFNQRMFNKIGEEFLNVIIESEKKNTIREKLGSKNYPERFTQILELVKKKYSLQEISSLTKLPESVLSTQIESLIGIIPELEIDSMFVKGELAEIYSKIEEGITTLKELRQATQSKISYAKLRIALAKKIIS